MEDAQQFLVAANGFFDHRDSPKAPSLRQAERHRHRAVSEILAVEANDDAEVRSFRVDHLPSGLLDWKDVDGWINGHAATDGSPSVRVVATWLEPEPLKRVPKRPPDHVRYASDPLAYAVPEDMWRRVIGVNEHGVLGRLRRLSERLAVEYGWQPGQATVYVLTGLTPQTTALRVTWPAFAPVKGGYPQPWRMRIQLEVDLTERPESVARAYRDARSEILRLHGHRRARLLSERTYALAVHAARRPDDESWADTMRRWDDSQPAWAYSHRADAVRQFRAEANEAIQRTLDPFRTVAS